MTLEQLPLIMLRALAVTILVECTVAWILGVRFRDGQITVVLANLLTNPLVVSLGAAASWFLGFRAVVPATLVMEVIAVAVEGFVYNKADICRPDPLLLSLICNAASYGVGEILNRFVY